MNPIQRTARKVDETQQRRPWLAFPFAVVKKFGDDNAGHLAANIAYYGFFSLFPLMLVLVTTLGKILGSGSPLAQRIQDSALAQFPVIGQQIRVDSLRGSGLALAIGIVGALWAGMGVTQSAQFAMNQIWDVKKSERPNFLFSRLRSLIMLAVLGAFTIIATVLSGLAGSAGTGPWFRVLGLAGSLVTNLALYMVAFRILTRKNLTWGDVFPGAAAGAVLWTIIQLVGAYYIQHQLTGAKATYGTFAFVIALLVWIYLGAQVTLYAAEINVVRKGRLWPRSLTSPPLTPGDQATFLRAAKAEERLPEEQIAVSFGDPSAEREGAMPHDGPVASHAQVAPCADGSRPTGDHGKRTMIAGAGLFALGVLVGRRKKDRRLDPRA
jgi:YihY family inner membrane protein